jgi:hypothetical protein
MIELSILLPSIHLNKLRKVYESLKASTNRGFEIIVVGPEAPPALPGNWKFKMDRGCPSRCHNIALELAEGKYVSLASDDMKYFSSRVDECLVMLDGLGDEGVVSGKHLYQGIAPVTQLKDDHYFIRNYPQHVSRFVPKDCVLVNVNFMRTDYLRAMGGLDSRFEHHGVAQVDLAVRLHNDGADVKLNNDPVCFVSHTDMIQGDHAPVHHAVVDNDEPLFREIYSDPENVIRSRIDKDNWKNADPVWRRRWLD